MSDVRLPHGKYAGKLLTDVPSAYLRWMVRVGFLPVEAATVLKSRPVEIDDRYGCLASERYGETEDSRFIEESYHDLAGGDPF